MALDHHTAVETASQYAERAAAAAEELKPGTWESVQALAAVSVAHSLLVLAEHSRQH